MSDKIILYFDFVLFNENQTSLNNLTWFWSLDLIFYKYFMIYEE
jgi:hypothetical protein